MTYNRKNRFFAISLLMFLLLPFGCGGDGKGDAPEDAFDSQGEDGEVVHKPFVNVAGFDEGEMTTAESSITIEGTTFYSNSVEVNGQQVEFGEELDEELGEGVFPWSIEVELLEGSNDLQIKAIGENDMESDPIDVVVIYDPEYVSDPPENSGYVLCIFQESLVWLQKNENYDPAGARPDEMHLDAVSTFRGNQNYSFNSSANSSSILSLFQCQPLREASFVETYRIDVHAWEEDDGFFTGGDDEVGTGSAELNIKYEDDWAYYSYLDANVGGNTLRVYLNISCNTY